MIVCNVLAVHSVSPSVALSFMPFVQSMPQIRYDQNEPSQNPDGDSNKWCDGWFQRETAECD